MANAQSLENTFPLQFTSCNPPGGFRLREAGRQRLSWRATMASFHLAKLLVPGLIIASFLVLTACNSDNGTDTASSGIETTSNGTNTTGEVNVSWVAPVQREDGAAISMSEIASYQVYYGRSEGLYTRQVAVNYSSAMNVTLGNLEPGAWHIAVTAVDTAGRESAYSQEVVTAVPSI
jgi:hypothetical protein